MSQVNKEIQKLYVLALAKDMDLNDVPLAWFQVEQAKKLIDPNNKMGAVPEYVKMVMRYGIQWGKKGKTNGAETEEAKDQSNQERS